MPRLKNKTKKIRLTALFLAMVLVISILILAFEKPKRAAAAITRSGSVINIQNAADSGSQAVTVPADATLAVLAIEGFSSTTNKISSFTSLTLGGSSMTLQRSDLDDPSDGNQSGIFTLVNPSTGSQTLSWNWGGTTAWGDGGQINIAFYKGVDTANPVGSKGGQGINGSFASATASSGPLTVASGDAIVATAYFWDTAGGTTAMAGRASWSNVTASVGPSFVNGSVGSFAEASPAAGSVTVSSSQTSAGNSCFTTMSAIVIKASAPTNSSPPAPTMLQPAAAETSISAMPLFQLRSTDANNDYLRYKIQLCQDSACSTVLQTYDQTASQTGWRGQDQQSGTAFTGSSSIAGSTIAQFLVPASLSLNTTYYWRAYAIDPAGSNTFSSASAIRSFTTTANNVNVLIQGGSVIQGGSIVE